MRVDIRHLFDTGMGYAAFDSDSGKREILLFCQLIEFRSESECASPISGTKICIHSIKGKHLYPETGIL